MSTTDRQGNITFANAAFVEVSGFSLEEVVGQPHNLVRHPDMPREAFADMWKTLQAGYSWSASSRTGARTATTTGYART